MKYRIIRDKLKNILKTLRIYTGKDSLLSVVILRKNITRLVRFRYKESRLYITLLYKYFVDYQLSSRYMMFRIAPYMANKEEIE